MHNGFSDIFDLLVRTGAGIQNCKRYAVHPLWWYFLTITKKLSALVVNTTPLGPSGHIS